MRSFHLAAVLAFAPLIHADNVASTSPKRGLCYVHGENPKDDDTWDGSESDLTWYYNYAARPTDAIDSKLQFVPMFWGADSGNETGESFYDTVKGLKDSGRDIEYALGFNEPDGCKDGGSCVDPDLAAELWIAKIEPLKDLDIKLGAPAVTGSPRGLEWLQNFFTACDGGCTPTFVPIHWYGNFEGMASYMGQVNATYQNMTMWVTEFGFPEQDLEATQMFFNQSISYLDRLDYVTHYSWFGAFRSDVSNVGPNNALLTSDGKITDIGAYYLGEPAEGNIPSSAPGLTLFAGWSICVFATLFWNFA